MRAALEGNDWPVVSDPVIQMIIAIAIVGWVTVARLVRGQMLSFAAARLRTRRPRHGCLFFTGWSLYAHAAEHVGPVIVAIIFGIPLAIFAEAALGFIGLSVPQPTASLGRLVSDGNN